MTFWTLTVVVILVRESRKVQIKVRSSCESRKIGHFGPVLTSDARITPRFRSDFARPRPRPLVTRRSVPP